MKSIIVEILGTAFFLYSILLSSNPLTIGCALAITIFVTSKFANGHFNPAVTLMLVSIGKHPVSLLIPYLLSQMVGSLIAINLVNLTTK